MTQMKIKKDGDWLIDENGNRSSIKYFGSKDKARNALMSLTRCKNCINCSGCSGCSRCSDCWDCRDLKAEKSVNPAFVVPVIPDIHQQVAAAIQDKKNTLDMSRWHHCDTTHCRGGWIIHLAGDAGYALENKTSYAFAAMQIAKAAGNPISPSLFFESKEEAMKSIIATAEKERLESPSLETKDA